MKKINLVYEYDYDDVDIILVPNVVAENIDQIVQLFFRWIESHDGEWQKNDNNGNTYIEQDTDLFLIWLNKFYCSDHESMARIVASHVCYNPNYPVADF